MSHSSQAFPSIGERTISEVLRRNAVYGAVESSEDINGVRSEVAYSAMGRQYFQGASDGSWALNYLASAGSECPANNRYMSVQKGADGSESRECFDKLGRSTRTLQRHFNGSWTAVDILYDELGRIIKRSEPYFSTGVASLWTTMDYKSES